MLITFRSAACANVIYFGDVAKRLMQFMGKESADAGIITVDQLPAAIAALREAIADDKQNHRRLLDQEEGETEYETAPNGASRPRVSLTQRALPLLEMLETSQREEKPVLWGQ